ncbi:MAG: HalOD1 output domain-containing protein [archaeon]
MSPGIDHSEYPDSIPVVESSECDVPYPSESVSETELARSDTYHVDIPGDIPIEVAITEAFEHVEGANHPDLEPLAGVVDTDDLDGLFASLESTPGAQATVSFPYASCWITVESTGSITITRTDART